jgi:hypothetical protein
MRVLRKVLVLCILVCGVTFLGPAPKAWSISLPLASVNAQTVDHASNEELRQEGLEFGLAASDKSSSGETSFIDVQVDHPYYEFIEALYQAGYTQGCSTDPMMYCPEKTLNRAESAVFVERGIHNAAYDPPEPTQQIFRDVALDAWYADWTQGLWEDGFTAGCKTDPLSYCPDQENTRAEGAVFYLRMMYGADYEPPSSKGYFKDVDPAEWYAKWVDAAFQAGIAEPCATDPDFLYCPEEPLTREVAAYMMVQAKGLLEPIPTPSPTPSPTPMPSPTPVGQTGDWNLIFQDEFDAEILDEGVWHKCFWWASETCAIESQDPSGVYHPDDAYIESGMLRLRAQEREMVGWNGDLYHYTSGLVITGGRKYEKPPGFVFTYGFVEARVRVPSGQGLWPAFWLLPANYESRPEIDIMEILGDTPSIQRMHYHWIGGDAGQNWEGPDFSEDWHTFAIDWTPEALIWYVDGVERWRFEESISDEPSYLLLNLSVGGNWPGSPDDSTAFPGFYDIDYVRVWKRAL